MASLVDADLGFFFTRLSTRGLAMLGAQYGLCLLLGTKKGDCIRGMVSCLVGKIGMSVYGQKKMAEHNTGVLYNKRFQALQCYTKYLIGQNFVLPLVMGFSVKRVSWGESM